MENFCLKCTAFSFNPQCALVVDIELPQGAKLCLSAGNVNAANATCGICPSMNTASEMPHHSYWCMASPKPYFQVVNLRRFRLLSLSLPSSMVLPLCDYLLLHNIISYRECHRNPTPSISRQRLLPSMRLSSFALQYHR